MKTKPRIYFRKLDQWYNPEATFSLFFGRKKYAFWLDSSKIEKGFSRFSYMGDVSGDLNKKISYFADEGVLTVEQNKKITKVKKGIFQYLKKELNNNSLKAKSNKLPFNFIGGFVGYLGYELYKSSTKNKNKTVIKNKFKTIPDSYFFFIDRFIAFDNIGKKVYLVCISEKKENADLWLDKINKKITRNVLKRKKIENKSINKRIIFNLSSSYEQYISNISKCQEYLRNGESYQICLTNKISANIKLNWLELYMKLRKFNPAPYGAYIRFNDFSVLSSSPEMFLKIGKERRITSKPIKGTIRRGKTLKEDRQLAAGLGKTEKDYAENIMIVDLVRNDLGKICQIGSINVTRFLSVETYATVHQLVSTVSGILRDDVSTIDAVKSCFPSGSMTGAPKLRTMKIISTLEKRNRGIYSGALGFISLNGTLEMSVVIRTIIAEKEKLSFGSGGAILLQSNPESEYDEMILKSKVLMNAVAKSFRARDFVIKKGRD